MARSSAHNPGSESFATTHWSVVSAARAKGSNDSPSGREALAWLCERYWYPLYAYVRRKGQDADSAADLTQAFFLNLLEKNMLDVADRERGRFRDFLLASMKHFLSNEWDRAKAQKRGGGKATFSLDAGRAEQRYKQEPFHADTPEKLFTRRWALEVLETVLAHLREDFSADGKVAHFEALKACLTGNADAEAYADIGRRLKMSEGAVKVAVYRLRRKYRQLLKAEIAATLAQPDCAEDVEAELGALFEALR